MLADLAASLGVADRVIFAGNRCDMPDIYHAVDALVLASHREGLSRTVMEAMACGLPCVVSGIRGNVDLIAHGENGFVCDADDADAYAAAMDALAADGDLCRTLGAHNREKVRGFAVEVVKARLAEIYRTVLLKEKEQNEDIAFAAK